MNGQTRTATTLAALFESNQEEITQAWAEKARHLPDAPDPPLSRQELNVFLSQGLAATIESLRTGSPQAVDAFLQEGPLFQAEAGFDIAGALGLLLLLRDAALPVLLRAYGPDPIPVNVAINQMDATLRFMATRLAGRFTNHIEQRLREQQKQAERLLETSESLRRVTRALLKKLATLDEVLELVCFEARQLTGATGSAVLLLENGDWLRVTGNSGSPSPVLPRLSIDGSLAGLVITQGQSLLLNDPEHQVQAYYRNPDLHTLLAIPLWAEESIIGVLDVVNKPGGFNDEDFHIMTLFADQAAIAIKNAQLHERAEKLAVVEERQRLARELHDSVTQALYSVNLYAEATRMALSAGKTEVAAGHLEALRHMSREAILDMRMLIFELHPPALAEEGLANALQARLEAVESRSGLQTEFHMSGDRRLSISVEEELYRIAQEALTNAVKHAQAQKVIVRLRAEDDCFSLEIQDDGVGFDPAGATTTGGLGLRSIKERVQGLHGRLTIDSHPGVGTTLRVTVND